MSPAFFHDGAFTRLEDAIRHHLSVAESARSYDPRRAGIDRDLRRRLGPERLPSGLAPMKFEACENGHDDDDN